MPSALPHSAPLSLTPGSLREVYVVDSNILTSWILRVHQIWEWQQLSCRLSVQSGWWEQGGKPDESAMSALGGGEGNGGLGVPCMSFFFYSSDSAFSRGN